MKIAYIVPSLANKGPVIVVNNLTKELVKMGVEVEVFYFDKKEAMIFDCPTRQIDINKAIDFDSYDIIHSNGLRPDKYLAKHKKLIKKAKTLSTIHSDIKRDLRYSHNFIVSTIFTPIWLNYIKKLDGCVVISDNLMEIYRNKFKNIFRVHNGVDISIDYSKTASEVVEKIVSLRENSTHILGTYAHITPIKGLEQLIKLIGRNPKLGAVIIGEGETKNSLLALSNKLNVADRVVFFDYQKEPYNYLPLFDVYTMCSRSEGFGLALVEAAMGGCPIVCSDIEVFREIFDESEVSFFTLDDIGSFDKAVEEAVLDGGKVKQEKASEKVKTSFISKAMAQNYIKVYRELIR